MTYFERPLTVALIFGSFFVLFVPLFLLQWIPNFVDALPYLALAHAVGLGTTHFFITLAVYVSRENLRYFASSTRNRLVYLLAPLLILGFFAWMAASDFRGSYPVAAAYLFGALRLADFFHVGRQSAGMQQIWKRPIARLLPSWSRPAENAFFVGMALMQWESFLLGGHFARDAWYGIVPAVLMFALFAAVALSYVRVIEQHGAQVGATPRIALSYFSMQALCAAVAVYDTRFYLAALSLHYVEYHVIMAPRCFAAVPGRGEGDRPAAWLRAHPGMFYLLLVLVVVLFELRNHVPGTLAPSTAFFVHIFDGIFFLHYFIEAFLWKFRNPYYRDALSSLYFTPPATPPARVQRSLVDRLVPVGAIAAVVGLAAAGALSWLGNTVQHRVIEPMRAEDHVRWATRLLSSGDAQGARAHLLKALQDSPDSSSARSLLGVAERNLAESRSLP